MLFQIKQTKSALLKMNEQQLQTQARLTMLQNAQLSSEVNDQAKACEELLTENAQKTQALSRLKREV